MSRKTTGRRPESHPEPIIDVQIATRAALPRGASFARWVEAAGARGVVTVRLVGASESRVLNERFRGKDGPTNVLAFPAGSWSGGTAPLGDLAICLPLVHREARRQGKSSLQHLAHLVVHGTLHLLGYDHDDEASARKMEAREVKILARLGFPDPYRLGENGPVPSRRNRQA